MDQSGVADGVGSAPARPLTRSQQARLQRVVDAAMELGLQGGYEAVQMRDVASRAHVAMGTVYRYFTSKDHLLAAALVHWVEQLDARLAQVPARGDSQADRVIDVLDRALRAMGKQPKLVEAVFSSLASSDPSTIECQNQISRLMDSIISRAMGEPQAEDFADRSRLLGHVWYSAIVGWVNGRTDLLWVHDEVAVAVRLLLGGESPTSAESNGVTPRS
ncbi:MAG: TetR family transcriptional regulator [Acidimicrobiales bacterium]|jgi:TetR/AcrR family transcriptional regulator, cholesterol catabolism regulator